MKKKVLIINTGGTISSLMTASGYEPKQNYLSSALKKIPNLFYEQMPEFTVKEYNPLIDSSNVSLSLWNQLAEDIAVHYADFDGFVIFHGTDTMAYTASALSFALEGLAKPVILTGSQIPLSVPRNDALDNIISALWFCANEKIAEVCVYFNHQLMRGNRTKKISAQAFNAFQSPNYPDLAKIGIDIVLNQDVLRPVSTEPFQLAKFHPQAIAYFRLFPGFSSDFLQHILSYPMAAMVLETYGAGNGPNHDPEFLRVLKKATDAGILVINCSQCDHGGVDMTHYATGHGLRAAGLISAFDMTLETVHCKLAYLLSKYANPMEIKEKFQENLRGELTR